MAQTGHLTRAPLAARPMLSAVTRLRVAIIVTVVVLWEAVAASGLLFRDVVPHAASSRNDRYDNSRRTTRIVIDRLLSFVAACLLTILTGHVEIPVIPVEVATAYLQPHPVTSSDNIACRCQVNIDLEHFIRQTFFS